MLSLGWRIWLELRRGEDLTLNFYELRRPDLQIRSNNESFPCCEFFHWLTPKTPGRVYAEKKEWVRDSVSRREGPSVCNSSNYSSSHKVAHTVLISNAFPTEKIALVVSTRLCLYWGGDFSEIMLSCISADGALVYPAGGSRSGWWLLGGEVSDAVAACPLWGQWAALSCRVWWRSKWQGQYICLS